MTFSPSDLEAARTDVTPARYAIADYGTVILRSDAARTELASLYAPCHVAVVAASDLLFDMDAAYEHLAADIAAREHPGSREDAGRETQVLAPGQ